MFCTRPSRPSKRTRTDYLHTACCFYRETLYIRPKQTSPLENIKPSIVKAVCEYWPWLLLGNKFSFYLVNRWALSFEKKRAICCFRNLCNSVSWINQSCELFERTTSTGLFSPIKHYQVIEKSFGHLNGSFWMSLSLGRSSVKRFYHVLSRFQVPKKRLKCHAYTLISTQIRTHTCIYMHSHTKWCTHSYWVMLSWLVRVPSFTAQLKLSDVEVTSMKYLHTSQTAKELHCIFQQLAWSIEHNDAEKTLETRSTPPPVPPKSMNSTKKVCPLLRPCAFRE